MVGQNIDTMYIFHNFLFVFCIDLKDEQTIIKHLILRSDTIVVPKCLRTQMMEIVHQGYME